MKNKNLQRAVILSLLLGSVAMPAWAADFTWNNKTDVSGTGAVIDNTPEAAYDNVNVLLDEAHENLWEETTTALTVKNGTELIIKNPNGEFVVVNNIKSDITLDEIQEIQNTTYDDVKLNALAFASKVIGIFNRIESFENNALFANGGSKIDVNVGNVRIEAVGGFTGLNAAISAENANVAPGYVGDNTVSITGKKVEIIGDVDMTKGAQDTENIVNTVNITLNSSDSYWYGSERRIDGWNNSTLNLTLANGAEWVYDNNVLLGKTKEEILALVKDTLIHESITSNETMNGMIDTALKLYLGKLKQVSSNEGSEISAITLEGGIVNLQDEDIKRKYGSYIESDLVDLLMGNNHQKVIIGELKGAGGIFKADIDWASNQGQKNETDNSDYIYITNSEAGSLQTLDFVKDTANLDQMTIGDKLYFANVKDGKTDFTTVYGDSWTESKASNIYDYSYGVASENSNADWFIQYTGKTAASNANVQAAKAAMYAGYALGTELDTLNKRMGEARYLEDDNGLWVRYRHSKTGWDNTYKTNSNMFQLGFDNKVTEKDGEHNRGIALDYTDANTNLTGISGEGEQERYAVSLYDTWTGDKGHYRDLVLRGGRINSDYDISGRFTGGLADIGGDYHQWFGSISAEWGRKNAMGSGWYIEPQLQAQLVRIGGASYVSNSGINVTQDGATSLIGRAGFRLGREYAKADGAKHDNYYIKANLLHEFAGDRSFSVMAADGSYAGEYDGDDTWFDIGLGADIALAKDAYLWVDVERTLGSDFDNTWQINGGLRWEW